MCLRRRNLDLGLVQHDASGDCLVFEASGLKWDGENCLAAIADQHICFGAVPIWLVAKSRKL